jgi:type I restriction enzyme, S subunit
MKHSWDNISLGEVVSHKKNFITIDDFLKYKLCRVQTKALGVVLREEKDGFEIRTKNQQVCTTNDLIFAEMDARFGGYGIIPHELDGAIVSSHYFLFDINDKSIDRKYLEYCLKQPWFLSQIEAKGSTNYAAIRPHHVLDYKIPLPPLSEQQRIVSKIEGIKTKLDQIKVLRAEQEKELNNLLFSKYTEILKDAQWLPMEEVAPIHRRQLEIHPDETYLRIGVRSFGRGLFENPSFKGSELTWQKIFLMKENDLLFSNANGWEGAVGLISKKYDGWVGSHRYITCLTNLEIINPEFLFYYFTTFEGVGKLSAASPGTVARTRTLNTKLLMKIKVPIPSLASQKEFVELLEKVNTIKQHHTQTNQELTELMPGLLDKAFKGEL